MNTRSGIFGAFLLIFSCTLMASEIENLEGIRKVTAPEVKELMESTNLMLIHTLSEIEYDIQHIKGSINVPVTEMKNTGKLPADKKHPLCFYCMGPKCPYSKRASLTARTMGYANIYWFQGGIPEWNQFNYPMNVNKKLAAIHVKKLRPKKVVKLLKKREITVVDVRPYWWKLSNAIIKGSVMIPLVDMHEKYTQLAKNKPIIINDAFMKQSLTAAKFLTSKGYDVIGVVKGGIARWVKEGLEHVEKTEE